MERLRVQLSNGDLLSAFRTSYRQKSGQSVEIALRRENSNKNRYNNVLPYDYNRVLLKVSSKLKLSSDYINASVITVRLPKNNNLDYRYIATQGPMENTVVDFWRMIWEQRVHTIIMLTDLIEMELPKCFKYWPEGENSDAQEYGSLLVSCIRVSYNNRHAVREFSLIHIETQQELSVVQLQFKGYKLIILNNAYV